MLFLFTKKLHYFTILVNVKWTFNKYGMTNIKT